jgi:hypothetical protein
VHSFLHYNFLLGYRSFVLAPPYLRSLFSAALLLLRDVFNLAVHRDTWVATNSGVNISSSFANPFA